MNTGENYRKKPVVIQAVQWDGSNIEWVQSFVGNAAFHKVDKEAWGITTLEGEMQANKGDYIIKGIKGEFYPCKPDIFKASYEKC